MYHDFTITGLRNPNIATHDIEQKYGEIKNIQACNF